MTPINRLQLRRLTAMYQGNAVGTVIGATIRLIDRCKNTKKSNKN